MRIDAFKDLLIRADSAMPPPAIAAGLAGRVRQRGRRQRIRRSALVAVAVLLAGGVVISRYWPPRATPDSRPMTAAQISKIRLELAHLEAEADAAQREVDRLRKLPQASEPFISSEFMTPPDGLDRVNEARNRTALILLREADRAAATNRAEAAALLSRAVHLFPETPAGRTAARRLKLHSDPI